MNRRHFLKTALAAPVAVIAPASLLAEDRITRFWRSRALPPGFKRVFGWRPTEEAISRLVSREARKHAKPILHARLDEVRFIETPGKTITFRRPPRRYIVR